MSIPAAPLEEPSSAPSPSPVFGATGEATILWALLEAAASLLASTASVWWWLLAEELARRFRMRETISLKDALRWWWCDIDDCP